MILSILIPTVFDREAQFASLSNFLRKQIPSSDDVEILHLCTLPVKHGGMPTGGKRQQLLSIAKGQYVVFIDDDDKVSEEYVSEILAAALHNPDVITFDGWMTSDGENRMEFSITLGSGYEKVDNTYLRPPNHLCPIKREYACMIGYDVNLSNGEDYDYCMRLKHANLLRTEIHIPKKLYHYDHQSTNKLYS